MARGRSRGHQRLRDGQQLASQLFVGGTDQLAGNEVRVLVEDQGENADADSQGAQPPVAHVPDHVGHAGEDEDRQDSGRSREVRVKDRRGHHDERQADARPGQQPEERQDDGGEEHEPIRQEDHARG
jgi:hypothetical protein